MLKVGMRNAATALALLSGSALVLSSGAVWAQASTATPKSPPPPAKPDAKGTPAKGDKSGPAKPPAKPKKKMSDAQKIEAAKDLFTKARQKYEANDYAGALPLYQEADAMWEGPTPKYFAAVCLDKLERYPEAIEAYKKFLDSKLEPAAKFAEKATAAKKRIDEIPKTPAKVLVTTEPANVPGLKFTIDGQPAPGPELAVPPGKHIIAATADGFTAAGQEIEVAYAEKRALTLKLTEAPKATPPPVAKAPPPKPATPEQPPTDADKDKGGGSRVPAYVTLGLAGAGAIVGTIFGVQALGAQSDFDANPTTDNAERVDRNALIADMSFAVAITFGVTGTVLLLSSGGSEKKAGKAAPPQRRAWVTPYVGPKGGGAAAALRF